MRWQQGLVNLVLLTAPQPNRCKQEAELKRLQAAPDWMRWRQEAELKRGEPAADWMR